MGCSTEIQQRRTMKYVLLHMNAYIHHVRQEEKVCGIRFSLGKYCGSTDIDKYPEKALEPHNDKIYANFIIKNLLLRLLLGIQEDVVQTGMRYWQLN